MTAPRRSGAPTIAEAVEACLADRAAQGLPRYVEDPVVLAHVATLVLASQGRLASQRRRSDDGTRSP